MEEFPVSIYSVHQFMKWVVWTKWGETMKNQTRLYLQLLLSWC